MFPTYMVSGNGLVLSLVFVVLTVKYRVLVEVVIRSTAMRAINVFSFLATNSKASLGARVVIEYYILCTRNVVNTLCKEKTHELVQHKNAFSEKDNSRGGRTHLSWPHVRTAISLLSCVSTSPQCTLLYAGGTCVKNDQSRNATILFVYAIADVQLSTNKKCCIHHVAKTMICG